MEKLKKRIKRTDSTRLTVYTGVFVCLGILLPYVTLHAFGLKGNIFLPMHIPVLLCGFVCGAKRGFLCAILTVTTSSLITDMPAAYPMLPIMLAELAMYGLMSGFLYGLGFGTVTSLVASMVAGRICYGVMFYILLFLNPSLVIVQNPLLSTMPVLSALILGVPGMIIQLALVPTIMRKVVIK